MDKEQGLKTQTYKEAIEAAYNFDYETGRRCMNLAKDTRIAKLKVEDILKFKKKSLDTLSSLKVLTDEEFSLFLNGKHILKSTRPIAKSRQKPQKPLKTENDEVLKEEVSNAPSSSETVPTAENNHNQEATKSDDGSNTLMSNQSDTVQITIAELKATIEKQNAVIEKQRAKIEKYERLMIGSSMPRFQAQNNTFPRIEDAS